MSIAFVDTETTGLDPDRHEIWEVGLIVNDVEYSWQLQVDLGQAEAIALRISGFHDRYDFATLGSHLWDFATDFADYTRGCHLAGAVISFDEERLRKLLRRNGACPEWHYHLIDVEALAVGYLAGQGHVHPGDEVACHRQLPWDSEALSIALGVDPTEFDRHTALGDARWAKAVYEAVMGPKQPGQA